MFDSWPVLCFPTQCSGKTKATVYRGQFFNLGLSNAGLVCRCVYTATQKVARYYVIPFECLSVRPSLTTSYTISNLYVWRIFFKLCMGIGIGNMRFGIAHELISFINNRVMALDLCK